MIELIGNKLSSLKNTSEKYNFTREFLQEFILQILDRGRYFKNLSFVGGTALRVLYNLPRFSEDLDFCLIINKNFNFKKMLQTIEKTASLSGFDIEISQSSTGIVFNSFIRFNKILYDLGLSNHKQEKLFIKLEIDSNPPKGYNTEINLINKNFLFKVQNYDLASLFASKLHAFLFRKYEKGRDFYDLLWFLTKNTPINYKLLNNAVKQTEGKSLNLNYETLKKLLIKKISKANFKLVHNELLPFLVNPYEIEYFTGKHFLNVINKQF